MEDGPTYQVISDIFKLTKVQVFYANYLIEKLNEDYSRYHFINKHEIKSAIKQHSDLTLTEDDISYTNNILEYDLYLIDKQYNGNGYKINHNGKAIIQRHSSFALYLIFEIKNRIEEAKEYQKSRTIKEQIENLTIKQLKGSIFQVNKWWLILIINAIVTLIVSVAVVWITYKTGLNP